MVKNGSVNDNDPTGTPLAIHLSGGQADFYVLDGNGTPVALIDGTGTQPGPTRSTPTAPKPPPPAPPSTSTPNGTPPASSTAPPASPNTAPAGTTPPPAAGPPPPSLADPNNANTYTCAADNPMNFTDPTGRDVYGAIAAAICGVAGIGFSLIGVLSGLVIGIGCTIIAVGDALTS